MNVIHQDQNNLIKNLEKSVEKSLNNLKLKKLYGILLHDSSILINYGKQISNKLLEMKQIGVVEKIGVSVYDEKEVDLIFKYFKPDIIQLPYNIFDQRFEKSGILEELKLNNVEIHVRSIFLQGLLLIENYKNLSIIRDNEDQLKKYWNIINDNNYSAVEACIKFVNKNKSIDKIIVGVNSLQQLQEIMINYKKKNVTEMHDFYNLHCNKKTLIDPRKW